jgi:hypothetical protein
VLASQIIRSLPESLEWMVLFDLSTLRRLAADETVRDMFFLPQSTDLDLHSHIVLTSQGTVAADRAESRLIYPVSGAVFCAGETEACLYRRFSGRFDLVPVDEADCLAIGEMPPFPPVLLQLRAEAEHGEARVIFAEEPSGQHYELLKAVGIEYSGGSHEGPYYVARFRNHLPTHIRSGILANFARTSHCNLFFFRHGSIDRALEYGLASASTRRVSWAAEQARQAVVRLADRAENGTAPTLQPPAESITSGDVVPLGFLLQVLNHHTSVDSIFRDVDVRKRLTSLLQSRRQGLLWPYLVGGQVSPTATALVLRGLRDPEAVEALETFADGEGGYYPWPLTDEEGLDDTDPGGTAGRRQADFATTCLIRALRNDAGLETKTGVEYLASRFEGRGGQCFANPYLVDWALASALSKDGAAREIRDRLAAEILASMNDDHSFGRFDVPISSAFAILSLAALGVADRTTRMAQLRLMDFMGPDGTLPAGTPFYSARVASQGEMRGRRHTLDLRLFGHEAVSTAAAALALQAGCSPLERDPDILKERSGEAHPRYGCRDHTEYVHNFALKLLAVSPQPSAKKS